MEAGLGIPGTAPAPTSLEEPWCTGQGAREAVEAAVQIRHAASSHHTWPIVTVQQTGSGLVGMSWVVKTVQTAGFFMRTPTLRGVCRGLEKLPEQMGATSHQHLVHP